MIAWMYSYWHTLKQPSIHFPPEFRPIQGATATRAGHVPRDRRGQGPGVRQPQPDDGPLPAEH